MLLQMLMPVLLFAQPVHAAEEVRTDADVLAEALSSCIDSIAVLQEIPENGTVVLRFASPARWTEYSRQTIESRLTAHGHTIADSTAAADWILALDSAEFRVVVRENSESWERSASVRFYYAVIDSGGVIREAGRTGQTVTDAITGSPDDPGDAFRISPAVQRAVIEDDSGLLRIASFAAFTGIILWLAFH